MAPINSKEEFLHLIEKNKGILYKVAGAYTKDAEDQKDLLQEMTIRLWGTFERYDDQYKLSTWMYRVALNTAISFYRKDRKRLTSTSLITESIIEETPDVLEDDKETNIRLLLKLINELKELDRALMILYLDSKTYKEIALILGITETNVATKIGRIKEQLKQRFKHTS